MTLCCWTIVVSQRVYVCPVAMCVKRALIIPTDQIKFSSCLYLHSKIEREKKKNERNLLKQHDMVVNYVNFKIVGNWSTQTLNTWFTIHIHYSKIFIERFLPILAIGLVFSLFSLSLYLIIHEIKFKTK